MRRREKSSAVAMAAQDRLTKRRCRAFALRPSYVHYRQLVQLLQANSDSVSTRECYIFSRIYSTPTVTEFFVYLLESSVPHPTDCSTSCLGPNRAFTYGDSAERAKAGHHAKCCERENLTSAVWRGWLAQNPSSHRAAPFLRRCD